MFKVKAEVLGDIYDITGAVVACITSDSSLVIDGVAFSVSVKGDSLQLAKLEISHNGDKKAENAVLNFHNELRKRKEDLVLCKADIAKLMSSDQEMDEDEGQRILDLIAISKNHAATIKEMEATVSISVSYQEVHKGESVELSRGRLEKLPFFVKPVVWCPKVEVKLTRESVEKEKSVALHGGRIDDEVETKFDVASLGTFVRMWGSSGSGQGQFQNPVGVAVSGGCVFVCDNGNDRLQVFTLDGTFVRMWGSSGSGQGQLYYPVGVAVSGGCVFVCEQGNARLQVFK